MADQHTILFSCTLLALPGEVGDLIRPYHHHEVLALNPRPKGTNDVVQPVRLVPEKLTGTVDEIVASFRARLEQYLRVTEDMTDRMPVAVYGGGENMVQAMYKAKNS